MITRLWKRVPAVLGGNPRFPRIWIWALNTFGFATFPHILCHFERDYLPWLLRRKGVNMGVAALFCTAVLYLAPHCVWLWIWLVKVDKLELCFGKWRHYGSIIVGQTLRCELRVSFADTNVEITSKPSCSYHFALINLEENKDSVTSVSNTQFTLWIHRGLPPSNSSLITETYHSFNSSYIR